MRKVLEMVFVDGTHRVVHASDGPDALEQLESAAPSLVLLDVGDGSPGGYEVCHHIKSRSPETPVVLMSSRYAPFDPDRGSDADAHIDKPFDSQALLDLVSRLERAPAGQTSEPSGRFAPAQAEYGSRSPMDPESSPVSLVRPAVASEPPSEPVSAVELDAVELDAVELNAVELDAVELDAEAMETTQDTVNQGLTEKLSQLGLTSDQVNGVLAISAEVIEQVVWEVVPTLAEAMIKEEIQRITSK